MRQEKQDRISKSISAGLLAKRARTKASKLYSNEAWDLVDAVEQGSIDIEEIKEEELPKSMSPMSVKERRNFVKEKAKERQLVQQKIKQLAQKREAFIAKKKSDKKKDAQLDSALIKSVRKQGKSKGFVFKP